MFDDIFSKYFPELYEDFERIILEKYISKGGKYFIKNLLWETIKKYFNENNDIKKLRNLLVVLLRYKSEYFNEEKVRKYFSNISSKEEIEKLTLLIMDVPNVIRYLELSFSKIVKYLDETIKELIREHEEDPFIEIFGDFSVEKIENLIFLRIILEELNKGVNEELINFIKEHIDYINLERLRNYKIYHSEYFSKKLREILLKTAIFKLPELSSFDYSARFIKKVLAPLLYLIEKGEDLKLLFEKVKENKGVGKANINQILASGQSAYNLKTIFTNLSKDTSIKNRTIVEKFINYYCEKFSVDPENVCKEHFLKMCFEK
ncbi:MULTISPECIES: hypothetical protein [unclassified Thermosipho (in: thermotogales)]|uniref:hypothetical protein n=1 Tax=unclassified Thermosipho (in: thermotogales) TaxID=2676525 RepID=UPI0009874A28|nr:MULTISPECIES: hypothetical protein [unclassified Thermosipho (in: thermotogales)]MBT1247357.1 hypothetical protein [Thermosipho sp. 1244]OOC46955.1 hypothetical protein XO09_04150 [Thermosipho sp. 1223]